MWCMSQKGSQSCTNAHEPWKSLSRFWTIQISRRVDEVHAQTMAPSSYIINQTHAPVRMPRSTCVYVDGVQVDSDFGEEGVPPRCRNPFSEIDDAENGVASVAAIGECPLATSSLCVAESGLLLPLGEHAAASATLRFCTWSSAIWCPCLLRTIPLPNLSEFVYQQYDIGKTIITWNEAIRVAQMRYRFEETK